jgi:hypothetical protein
MDYLGFQSLIGILVESSDGVKERSPVGSQRIVSIPDRDSITSLRVMRLLYPHRIS